MMSAWTRLGPDGPEVPRLGIGTFGWGMDPAPGFAADEAEALRTSLDGGAWLIDTAAGYQRGETERRVGALLTHHRGRLAVSTKAALRLGWPASHLAAELDASLDRLQLDRVDLFQVECPSPLHPIADTMRALATIARAGRARSVGVSNYGAPELRQAHQLLADHGVPLVANQVQYSLLHRAPEVDGTLETCRALGIRLVAWSPLASGALARTWRSLRQGPDGRRRIRPERLPGLEGLFGLLAEIGAGYGRSTAEVALRWLLEDDQVIALSGARTGVQAATNLGALRFRLSAEERAALSAAADTFTTQSVAIGA